MHPSEFRGALDWFINPIDTAVQPAINAACGDQAAQQTAPLDAVASDLSSTWNPSDYFAPDDVNAIVGHQQELMSQAWDALTAAAPNAAASGLDNAQGALNDAITRLGKVNQQATDYSNAVIDATNSGANAIHAPGMKDWAVETVRATSWAMDVASQINCTTPGWWGRINTIVNLAQKFAAVLKTIAGMAASLVKTAYNAIENTFTFVGWLVKWGPTLALVTIVAGGLGFVAFKFRKNLKPAMGV